MENHAPTKKRNQQKTQTRERVLATAKELFLEKGYEKTTMRHIAARAGIAVGTIFSHFPDKPSLLVATLHKDMEDVLEKAYASLPKQESITGTVAWSVGAIFRHLAKTPDLSRAWLKESMFARGPWGELLWLQIEQATELIQALLQDAKYKGRLRPESPCGILAQAIMSFYYTVLVAGLKDQPDPDAQTEIFTQMTDSLLAGHLIQGRSTPTKEVQP